MGNVVDGHETEEYIFIDLIQGLCSSSSHHERRWDQVVEETGRHPHRALPGRGLLPWSNHQFCHHVRRGFQGQRSSENMVSVILGFFWFSIICTICKTCYVSKAIYFQKALTHVITLSILFFRVAMLSTVCRILLTVSIWMCSSNCFLWLKFVIDKVLCLKM